MKVSTLGKSFAWILLGSLLLISACAGGGEVQYYQPYSYPVYQPPSYYPYYPDFRYYDQDPQFWPMWQDRQGGG